MSKFTFKTESQDSDNDILLPINTLYPPNQIINKSYSPDVKPLFKFISPEKKQKRRVTVQPQNLHPSIFDFFDQRDTLGYQYANLLRKKLVYLKYNNSSFMKLNINGKIIKYLAGMFIPLEKLLSDSLKKSRNIYKTLSGLEYIENKHPVDNSFNTNCTSAAPNLRFSSNYEGSNLYAAMKVGQAEYDLILQNDINSKGNTQWFNFTIEVNEERNYKFNIVNLTKKSSLYEKGMNIAYCSQSAKINHRTGWTKGCHNISYSATGVSREDNQNRVYYCLHFEYKSHFKNDVVTFAYSFPYSLIELEKFFNKIMIKRPIGSLKIERIKVAETLTGFSLNAFAFTHKKYQNKNVMYSAQNFLDSREQGLPSVIFLARQHPGQSQGSYVAEGIVEWLLQGDYDSWKKSYHFYVIPMVNMDGVFYGNYRTNLSGNDLNRIWRHPRRDYHCEIHSIKKFLHNLNKTNPISLIIDIHGHSNSLNSFFYGNPPSKKDSENPRLFPYYCSRKVKQISYGQSTFSVSEDKKACARVVLSEMFPKALVYTFENSFYGWKKGKNVIEHTIDSYRRLGKDLVQCYIEYARLCEKNPIVKERWVKQIQEFSTDFRDVEEEIVSESDDQAENQLVQFEQMRQTLNQTRSSGDILRRDNDSRKKSMPIIAKNQFIRYMRRHTPNKLRNYQTSNETYIMDKSPEATQEHQGFLSIVKINTKSHLDSVQPDKEQKVRKASLDKEETVRDINRDVVIEDFTDERVRLSQKQNSLKNTKINRLINEKEMIIERMKQNRQRLEEGMIHSKTSNGFFRYNYVKK